MPGERRSDMRWLQKNGFAVVLIARQLYSSLSSAHPLRGYCSTALAFDKSFAQARRLIRYVCISNDEPRPVGTVNNFMGQTESDESRR